MKSFRTVDEYGIIRYLNERGELHRTDGPAYELSNGHKEWYINDELHREDGPAVVYRNGYTEYYLYNLRYKKEDWEQQVLKRKIKRLKDL